ncbi:MAG TPA: ribose-5-phosphate isomerase RpiA, partial [Kofleriaceae bacterium]|nr:ribose-5-phosphate isomerase RpiA [Kofleriaceae bacterium]
MSDEMKQAAALAALAELPAAPADGRDVVIGIGTGSTAKLFIAALGARVAAGARYVCVPTSQASRAQAAALGMPLLSDDGPWDIEVTVDGADEVSDALDLIKGGGAAHTREKIVNFSSRRNVIIVDASKRSPQLGVTWPVPLEILPFAHLATAAHLAAHGAPTLRRKDGAPVRTDAGNLVYDLACGPIADPRALDAALRAIPGVVETGLFVGRADVVIVAGASGI